MSGFDVTEQLKTIKNKTLVIHGDDDRTVAFAAGELINEQIPNSTLHVLR